MRRCVLVGLILLGTATMAPAQDPLNGWYKFSSLPGSILLYRNGTQAGAVDVASGLYYPLLDPARKVWGSPTDPLCDYPDGVKAKHFGVDRSKTSPAETHGVYRATDASGTREISRSEAIQQIREGLKDEAGKLQFLVIAKDEAIRKRVLAEAQSSPYLADLRDHMLFRDYPPDHWHLRGVGYDAVGEPTICVVRPLADGSDKGEVLHRQNDYQGAGDFAGVRRAIDRATVTAKREPAPGYDRTKDLDGRTLFVGNSDAVFWLLLIGVEALAVVALALVAKGRVTHAV